MASSVTPVPSDEHVEAGLTARPRRAGLPSSKLRSADNAAVPALSSHRSVAVPTQANASHESPASRPTLNNQTVSLTPTTTSIPNTPLITGLVGSPSTTSVSASVSASSRATATGDGNGVEVQRARICK